MFVKGVCKSPFLNWSLVTQKWVIGIFGIIIKLNTVQFNVYNFIPEHFFFVNKCRSQILPKERKRALKLHQFRSTVEGQICRSL